MDMRILKVYGLKIYIQKIFWFRMGYHGTGSGRLLVGLDINSFFGFSYLYEMSTNGFQKFNDGSHDLILDLCHGNFKKRRYSW